jgi:hypothetical protein
MGLTTAKSLLNVREFHRLGPNPDEAGANDGPHDRKILAMYENFTG